jgi:two-component system, OmpR family, KDP operon response regulator KdpE
VAAIFTCGEIEIDFARRAVRVQGKPVALTRTEFDLLNRLAVNANRVMSQEELLTAVWGPEYRSDVDYLRAYVRYLRRKLEPDPAHPKYIVTYPGVGYMLACPESD